MKFFRSEQSGGLLEVLRIALPLILSSASHAVNLFVDRIMLTHYSEATMSAAFPAGLTAFTISCFFLGTVGYSSTFVAQYVGAKQFKHVGVAVWQGLIMAFLASVFMAFGYFYAPWLFALFGHKPELQPLEVTYFRIIVLGNFIPLAVAALCNFWGGRGRTSVIMIVNMVIVACNIPLNYLMIFGNTIPLPNGNVLQIPEMGIAGAAFGTLASGFIGLVILAILFLKRSNREIYHTFCNPIDLSLLWRLFRFGAPNGLQFFLDLAAFNSFVVVLGRINETVLAASGVAFSVNTLAFVPMIGLAQTAGILVGQSIGAHDIPHAERSVCSARSIVIGYMILMSALFAFYPDPIIQLFDLKSEATIHSTRVMLYYISGYLVFDGLSMLYGNAIKGAGDTRFAMYASAGMAWFLFALPCIFAHVFFQASEHVMWAICIVYMLICSSVFYLRYRSGKWKTMSVIEDKKQKADQGIPLGVPCVELE